MNIDEEIMMHPVLYAILYISISICVFAFLTHDEYTKYNRTDDILMNIILGFTPGFNIISFLLCLALLSSDLFDYLLENFSNKYENKKIKKEAVEKVKIQRLNDIYAFLKYKGIEKSELDDFINSRSLMDKLIDKIS